MAALLVLFAGVMIALGACGADRPRFDIACLESAAAIERALRAAPNAVALPGGTRLSECVARARTDGDLQGLGLVLTRASDHLTDAAAGGDGVAALRLGYLVGAVRRGARHTEGIHLELQRRIERATARVEDPAMARELRRGTRAGERLG